MQKPEKSQDLDKGIKKIYLVRYRKVKKVIIMPKHISAKDLKEKIDSGEDFNLVNVLGEDSFENEHIPGSINIPSGKMMKRAKEELPEKDEEIIVYCASTSCKASTKAGEKLEEMGYENVVEFDSGISGWKENGYELEGRKA